MSRAAQFYGAGNVDVLFGGAPQTNVPWQRAYPSRTHRVADYEAIHYAVNDPERHGTTALDPRHLLATQPGLQRAAAKYYLEDPAYQHSGETFADKDQVGNNTPVVFHNENNGNLSIESGHHRAIAALLAEKQFHALLVSGTPQTHTDARAFQEHVANQNRAVREAAREARYQQKLREGR